MFFEGRFILGVTGWENSAAAAEAAIWSCLALSILIGDVANHWQEIRLALAAPTGAQILPRPEAIYSIEGPTA